MDSLKVGEPGRETLAGAEAHALEPNLILTNKRQANNKIIELFEKMTRKIQAKDADPELIKQFNWIAKNFPKKKVFDNRDVLDLKYMAKLLACAVNGDEKDRQKLAKEIRENWK